MLRLSGCSEIISLSRGGVTSANPPKTYLIVSRIVSKLQTRWNTFLGSFLFGRLANTQNSKSSPECSYFKWLCRRFSLFWPVNFHMVCKHHVMRRNNMPYTRRNRRRQHHDEKEAKSKINGLSLCAGALVCVCVCIEVRMCVGCLYCILPREKVATGVRKKVTTDRRRIRSFKFTYTTVCYCPNASEAF